MQKDTHLHITLAFHLINLIYFAHNLKITSWKKKNQWLVYLLQVLCFTNYLDAHIPKLLVVLLRLDKLSLHVQIFSKDSGCNVLDAILKLSLFSKCLTIAFKNNTTFSLWIPISILDFIAANSFPQVFELLPSRMKCFYSSINKLWRNEFKWVKIRKVLEHPSVLNIVKALIMK